MQTIFASFKAFNSSMLSASLIRKSIIQISYKVQKMWITDIVASYYTCTCRDETTTRVTTKKKNKNNITPCIVERISGMREATIQWDHSFSLLSEIQHHSLFKAFCIRASKWNYCANLIYHAIIWPEAMLLAISYNSHGCFDPKHWNPSQGHVVNYP